MNSILASFQDTPALIECNRTEWFQTCTEQASKMLAAIETDKSPICANDNSFWPAEDDWRAEYRPYKVANGILQVPVRGVLVKNLPWQIGSYATGYEYIYEAIKRGLADTAVTGIALVIESGGGMVAGNWDLVEYISASRDIKPIRAIASEYAYSAAYNIAAATSHITVSRTGGLGSIGVIVTHFDYSKMMESRGITVNFIRSKNDKAEGNPYEALSKGARARIQSDVDELHSQFVNMVATNRSMSESDVDGTDAHTFMGKQALDAGLADAVDNLNNALTAFEATFLTGDEPMADYTQAQYDAAVAAARTEGHASGVTEGTTAGIAEGQKQAVVRINAILGSEEGKARPKGALSAALKTSMSLEEATAFLSDLDAEAPAAVNGGNGGAGAGAAAFNAALAREGNSNISTDAENETGNSDDAEEAALQARVNGAVGLAKGPKKTS